jgi:hypothetical protein
MHGIKAEILHIRNLGVGCRIAPLRGSVRTSQELTIIGHKSCPRRI